MSREQFPNWVPDDTLDTRKDTATLLVGTAKEFGLTVRHHVASTRGGFYISDALAEVVYDETAEDEQVEAEQVEPAKAPAKSKAAKKTSGNRAAKNQDS